MTEVDAPFPREEENTVDAISYNRSSVVRVLVVDDQQAACKLLAIMLGPPAFHCTTASSSEEAVVVLQHESFDAVISDLHMPGIGGMELLNRVRRCYRYTALLVTTGVDDVDVGVEAMRCGADDYLVNPLRESAVLASLESALQKRHLERQVENYRQHLEEMVAERTGQVREALRKIEQSYEETLQALGAAIDLRDNETAGHSRRVAVFRSRLHVRGAGRTNSWEVLSPARTCTISESLESPITFFSSQAPSLQASGN